MAHNSLMMLVFSGALLTSLSVYSVALAGALPPLAKQTAINDGLFSIAVADHIRKNCDQIDGRLLKGYWKLAGLYNKAIGLGYSNAEVTSYVEDPEAKAAMRARAEIYFKDHDVRGDDPSGICTLGFDEIAKGSPIGALLRAK